MLEHNELLKVVHIASMYPNSCLVQDKVTEVYKASEALWKVMNTPAGKSHLDLLNWQNSFIAAKLQYTTALTELYNSHNMQ